MNNLQLDCALAYLNEGRTIDPISFLIESVENEIDEFNTITEDVNIITESKAGDIMNKIWEKIKEFVRKAIRFIDNTIYLLKGTLASLKDFGAKNVFGSMGLVAYAKKNNVPPSIMDDYEKIFAYISPDKELKVFETNDKITDNIFLMEKAVIKFDQFIKALNLYTGDNWAKDFLENYADPRTKNINSCLETIEDTFSKIKEEDFKLISKKRSEINDNEFKKIYDISDSLQEILLRTISVSLKFKGSIKSLEKTVSKHKDDDDSDVIGKNARLMLDYFNRGLSTFSKIHSDIARMNKVTFSVLLSLGKAGIEGYAAQQSKK